MRCDAMREHGRIHCSRLVLVVRSFGMTSRVTTGSPLVAVEGVKGGLVQLRLSSTRIHTPTYACCLDQVIGGW